MRKRLYYIQDTRMYIGTAMLFREQKLEYHTTDITKAVVVDVSELATLLTEEHDVAWYVEHVDKHVSSYADKKFVNIINLDIKYSLKKEDL